MAIGLFQFSRSDSLKVSYFHVTKWLLRTLGFWPSDPLSRMKTIKIILNLTILGIAIIGEIRFCYLIRRDPLYILDVLSTCIAKLLSWMKLFCCLIYRKDLQLILKRLYEHCKKDAKNFEKNAMIAKVSYLTTIWCLVLFINASGTSCLFSMKPLLIWIYQFCINGNRNTWVALPFQAALPYEDMTQIGDKRLYTLIYCCLTHSGFVTIFGLCGIDGMILCFCMYISVAYQCLQEDFKLAFKNHTARGLNLRSSNLLYNDLKELVKRQQNIIEIFKNFNRICKYVVFLHFALASILLGIVLINIRLAPGMAKVIYLNYIIGASNLVFIYCYASEAANQNCLKLSEILYFCEWFNCNKRVKTLILFVLIKSQKGSYMRVPFFSPSLSLFATIIQKSGSYFTILQSFL